MAGYFGARGRVVGETSMTEGNLKAMGVRVRTASR